MTHSICFKMADSVGAPPLAVKGYFFISSFHLVGESQIMSACLFINHMALLSPVSKNINDIVGSIEQLM